MHYICTRANWTKNIMKNESSASTSADTHMIKKNPFHPPQDKMHALEVRQWKPRKQQRLTVQSRRSSLSRPQRESLRENAECNAAAHPAPMQLGGVPGSETTARRSANELRPNFSMAKRTRKRRHRLVQINKKTPEYAPTQSKAGLKRGSSRRRSPATRDVAVEQQNDP